MAADVEWVTLAEAARQLGVSVHAARRRVKAGTLAARQVPTRHGAMWEVCLDPGATVAEGSRESGAGVAQPRRDPDASGVSELVGLVDRLQRENRDMAGLVGSLQARLHMVEEQLQLALEAPKEEPVAVEPTPAAEAVSAPAVRPWWRRWFG
jgi:hypothetical protein